MRSNRSTQNKAAKRAPENKAAKPADVETEKTLEESNQAADKVQADSLEQARSGEQPSREELAASGYRFPEGHYEAMAQDVNAGQPSTEHRSGDGGRRG